MTISIDEQDLLDAIRDQLANFAVGLVKRVEGAGSTVLGSGVLVSIEGRRGILTCGHVAEVWDREKLPEIGLVRFIEGTHARRVVDLSDAKTLIIRTGGGDKWTERGFDLAFAHLDAEVAASIGSQSLFLNIEKNRDRIASGEPANAHSVDVMFGMVAEYSGKPVIEGGTFISPMKAVIYLGDMYSEKDGLIQFRTKDRDPALLPKSFGGLSGSGLWRIYFREHGGGKFEITEKRLWGIASWQHEGETNTGAVSGQGWYRIDYELIQTIRDKL